MRKRQYVITTGVLGLCLALTACGGARGGSAGDGSAGGGSASAGNGTEGSARPKTATLPAGFKEVGGAANGFTIAVPKTWTTVDLTSDDLEQGLRRTGLSGAVLEQTKLTLKTLASNKAVWAADRRSVKASPTGFATNLNGFCTPGSAPSAGRLISTLKGQLEGQLKATVSEASEVRVNAGKAVRVVYTFSTGGLQIRGTQYYVRAQGKICTVTLSTDLPGRQRLFDRIGRTIQAV